MKGKKIVSYALATVMTLQGGGLVFAAGDNSHQLSNGMVNSIKNDVDTSKNEFSEYDKYVKVINNKYALELPKDFKISPETLKEIQALIDYSNKLISERNLIIDLQTKVAIKIGKCVNGEGVNSIEFHWNYVRVHLSATTIRAILQAGTSGASAVIAIALSETGEVAIVVAAAFFWRSIFINW